MRIWIQFFWLYLKKIQAQNRRLEKYNYASNFIYSPYLYILLIYWILFFIDYIHYESVYFFHVTKVKHVIIMVLHEKYYSDGTKVIYLIKK